MKRAFFFILFVGFAIWSIAQPFADKRFYLIDSLVLDSLVKEDRNLLDSCLTLYHRTEDDTLKLILTKYIIENAKGDYWYSLQKFQLQRIEGLLKKGINKQESQRIKQIKSEGIYNLGFYHYQLGDYKTSLPFFLRSLDLAIEINSKYSIAINLFVVGSIYNLTGDPVRALKNLKTTLMLFKGQSNGISIASLHNEIAQIYHEQHDLYNALIHYKFAWRIAREKGEEINVASILSNIGLISYQLGSMNRKWATYIRRSFELNKKMGNIQNMITSLANLGYFYLEEGDTARASSSFFEALDIITEEGDEAEQYRIRIELLLGAVYLSQRKFDLAEQLLLNNLKDARKRNDLKGLLRVYELLGILYEKEKKPLKALNMYKQYRMLEDRLYRKEEILELEKRQSREKIVQQRQQLKLMKKEKEVEGLRFKLSIMIYVIILIAVLGFVWRVLVFRRKKFEKELNHLRALISEKEQKKEEKKITSISVATRKKVFSVDIKEVVYFRTEGRYVFLVDKNGKSYIIDYRLNTLENSLPDNFVRIHRSSIVNSNEVAEVLKPNGRNYVFLMKDDLNSKVISSRGYVANAKKLILVFRGKDS